MVAVAVAVRPRGDFQLTFLLQSCTLASALWCIRCASCHVYLPGKGEKGERCFELNDALGPANRPHLGPSVLHRVVPSVP